MEKKIKRILFQTVEVAITLAIIAFFVYSIFNFGGLKDQYTQETDTNYIILFVTAIFLEAAPQLVSVSLILTGIILAGTTPHTAIFIVTAGSFIGSLIGFLIGWDWLEIERFLWYFQYWSNFISWDSEIFERGFFSLSEFFYSEFCIIHHLLYFAC